MSLLPTPQPQPQPFFVPLDDAAPDHVAWPSIENLGVSYASAIKNRTSAVLHAVLCLQRWWRWAKAIRAGAPYQPLDYQLRDPRKPGRAITPAGIYHRIRSSLNLYDASPCCATEKYDGTNVGKSALSRDVLFGRRSTIAASSLAFQKAPLLVVRSYDSVRVSEAIVAALLPEQRAHVRDVVLYGELMLGHDKFAYRPRGIESGHWVCFGARIVLNDTGNAGDDADGDDANEISSSSSSSSTEVDVARDICQRLREQGFAVTSGLTMFMADKLRELIGDAFPTVNQVAAAPSITDLILNSPAVVASLRDSRCEGVVVSGNNGEIAVKWKSSKEEESQAAALLAQALDIASDRCYRASIAIDDRHLQAMEILRSIAAVLSTPAAASASKPAAPKPVKLDPTAVYATELATAYASALTKYDELSVYFAQGDKGIATITNAIIAEIRADLEANARNRALVAEATPPNAQELKAIEVATNLYVRRTIGKAVGSFKKGK